MDAAYTVVIQPHGRTLRVRANQPLLDAALAAGLNLPHSCKSGHCSSCRARLIRGEVHYPKGTPLGITASEVRDGHVLMCQAQPLSDVTLEARLIANVTEVEIKTLPCRIAQITPLAPDVLRVMLRLPAVERLTFQPGQYIDVLLEDGRRRSFSLACPPHDSEQLELHVRRAEAGRFTDMLFQMTAPGALLRIEGPLGQFTWHESPGPVLLIAGGTGFAPLKSMLRHVLERGGTPPIYLYWGAREAQDVYEEQLILDWVARHPQLRFHAVLSHACEVTRPHQRLGWVHEAVLADHPDLSNFEVYAAGPPALIEAIRARYPSHGLCAQRLHFDSFDYAPG